MTQDVVAQASRGGAAKKPNYYNDNDNDNDNDDDNDDDEHDNNDNNHGGVDNASLGDGASGVVAPAADGEACARRRRHPPGARCP